MKEAATGMFIDTIRSYMPQNEQEERDKAAILEFAHNNQDTVLSRDNRIAHITSSGFVMNEGLNKVLMIHHNIYDTWAWTGGHADGNGDLLEVSLAEAAEETGASSIRPLSGDIASIDIVPVYGHMKRGEYVSSHLHLNVTYILLADDDDELRVKPDENSGVKWIDVSEIGSYSNEPYLIRIYEKLIERALAAGNGGRG